MDDQTVRDRIRLLGSADLPGQGKLGTDRGAVHSRQPEDRRAAAGAGRTGRARQGPADVRAHAPGTGDLPDARFQSAFGTAEPQEVRVTDLAESMISADAIVVDGRGTGTIGFEFAPADPAMVAGNIRGCRRFCEVRTGPRGEKILVLLPPDDSGVWTINVTVYSGQTAILAASGNWDQRRLPSQGWPLPVTRPDPPLGVEDLIAIATAPELTLFPTG